jgi:hypothetical protein
LTEKAQKVENEIKIDKEGNWFYNGAQIINRNILLFFCDSLENDNNGGYLLRVDKETSPVIVENTPFVVVDAVKNEDVLKIQLNDESVETFNVGSFFIDRNSVPYCRVKKGKFPARFLRKAYYRIAEYFEQDEDERFFVRLDNKKFYVNQEK